MDEALIDSTRALPARDFEALFESQFNRLARLVRRVVGDPAEAEDLAADVLWKCFRKQPAAINLEGMAEPRRRPRGARQPAREGAAQPP